MLNLKILLPLIVITFVVIGVGFFAWQYFGATKPVVCTQEAKVCPDGSVVGRTGPNCEFTACPADETADWQTYRNEEYGFELKYPTNWEINTEKLPTWSEKAIDPYFLLISIKDQTGGKIITINIESDSENHSLGDWIKIKENNPVGANFSKLENILIAELPAVRGTFGCCMSYPETILFVKDNSIFEIQGGNLGIYPHTEHYDYENIFNQMLSTFKFLE